MSTAQNVDEVQERIAAAARRVRRDPREIKLMAVSKTFAPQLIRETYAAGIHVFGENRVQEFSSKAPLLTDLKGAEWHMIGHLQTNKAGKAVELFNAIDSVDSLRLAEKLNSSAKLINKQLQILIEVNVGGEEAKSGILPDSHQLEDLLQAAPYLDHLHYVGLMTIPPFYDDPENARPHFRKLRELRDHIVARKLPDLRMDVLSMGMSHDFEIAIEEGATCVRIGTAIFGVRAQE